nr:MAG TPA: hypothetical protein [Caudoviricetes sp.]
MFASMAAFTDFSEMLNIQFLLSINLWEKPALAMAALNCPLVT